jgi:Domain of unknown function (DUF4397)
MKLVQRWSFVALFVLAALIAGCGGGGSSSSTNTSTQLRVLNALASTRAIDATLDSTIFVQGVAYGSASAYSNVAAGQHSIVIEPSGTTASLVTQPINLVASTQYTALASGQNLPSLTMLADNLTAPASGNFKFRVINASESVGFIDVYVTAPNTDLASATPGVSNLSFNSSSTYLSLAAGSYEIRVTPSGSKAVIFDSGTASFASGQIRTAVALDVVNGGINPFTVNIIADLN